MIAKPAPDSEAHRHLRKCLQKQSWSQATRSTSYGQCGIEEGYKALYCSLIFIVLLDFKSNSSGVFNTMGTRRTQEAQGKRADYSFIQAQQSNVLM